MTHAPGVASRDPARFEVAAAAFGALRRPARGRRPVRRSLSRTTARSAGGRVWQRVAGGIVPARRSSSTLAVAVTVGPPRPNRALDLCYWRTSRSASRSGRAAAIATAACGRDGPTPTMVGVGAGGCVQARTGTVSHSLSQSSRCSGPKRRLGAGFESPPGPG